MMIGSCWDSRRKICVNKIAQSVIHQVRPPGHSKQTATDDLYPISYELITQKESNPPHEIRRVLITQAHDNLCQILPNTFDRRTKLSSGLCCSTVAGAPLQFAGTNRLVTDGGQNVVETDGETISSQDTNQTGLNKSSDDHRGGSDVDSDSLEGLSRSRLIALLGKVISDNESSVPSADESAMEESDSTPPESTTMTDASAATTSEPTTGTTTSATEPADEGPDNSTAVNDTSVPDESTDQPAWESAEDYQRPSELKLTPGKSVLIQCGSQDDRKETARKDLLGLSESDGRNVLLILYQAMTAEQLETISTGSQRLKVITVGCTQPVPDTIDRGVETVQITNPNDVTRLGILATSTLNDWDPLDGQVVVSFDPLDVMFQYKTTEATFRFLHIFLGKLSSREALSHFFVNPSASDPQAINTLKPLFDDVLTIDSVGVDVE